MLTDTQRASETTGLQADTKTVVRTTAQKVVIVNGSPEVMGLVETILEAGRYDIVFVESSAHAYSRIKLVHPSLVVLCVSVDDLDGFRVLSMLKLDHETRHIPILTYSTDYERQSTSADDADTLTAEALSCNSARWMN